MAPKKQPSDAVAVPAPQRMDVLSKSEQKAAKKKLKQKSGAKGGRSGGKKFPIDIVKEVKVSGPDGQNIKVDMKDITVLHKQLKIVLPKKASIVGCHISVLTNCTKNGCRHEYFHSHHALPKVYYGRDSLYKPLCFVRPSKGGKRSVLQYIKIRPRNTGHMAPTEKEKKELALLKENPIAIESFSEDVVVMVKVSAQSWWQKVFSRKEKGKANGRS